MDQKPVRSLSILSPIEEIFLPLSHPPAPYSDLVQLVAGAATQFRVFDPIEGEQGTLQPAEFAQRRGDTFCRG
jgi:hypothetical protein